MSYVKWNSSKYHILNSTRIGRLRIVRPASGPSWVDISSEGGAAVTICGKTIPAGNEILDSLPTGIDQHNEVCHGCSNGVGVPKVDHAAERARQTAAGEETLKRFNARRFKAAKDLFD